MRNLLDFQAPSEGEVTLCEVEGRVHSMNYEFANVNVFTKAVECYPAVYIARDSLHNVKPSEDVKELFLSVDIPILKHLVQIYYEHGFIETLETASKCNQFLLSGSAKVLLKLLSVAQNIRTIFNPNVNTNGINMIMQVSQTNTWLNGPIRCLAWHFDTTKLAVASCDDCVRIYYKHVSLVPLLKCKQQKNITAIEWRPMSDSDIAVACKNHIIIWNIDPNSVITRPSVSSAIILYRVEHQPIVSIAWSPHGDILATAAACDSSILLWDVELNRTSNLKRPGCIGNTLLKWSPTGEKMLSSTSSLVFRVWECQFWQPERWNVLTGRVQAACWSPDGIMLLFTTTDEPIIYGLSFLKSDYIFARDSSNSPNQAIPLYDVSKVDIDGVIVGGIVRSMDWDSSGNHLAVMFQETNCVAIFTVTFSPAVQLNASCLVAGAPEEIPTVIQFQKNFEHGACLTIAWSSGRLQYFPLIYSSVARLNELNNSFLSL